MLQPGITLTLEKTVLESDSAKAYGSGMVDVLATPAMIGFMEQTCMELALPYLDAGHNTVGTEVNIRHLKATPIGRKISCKAELVECEGKMLRFKLEVHDESGLAGDGFHTRYIIHVEKFMSKIQS